MTGNQLDFTVRDRGILVQGMRQYETRGECALEILSDLVANWPELFEGVVGTVFYGDAPPPPDKIPAGRRVFCTTIRLGTTGRFLPFPCFSSLRWPEIGITNGEELLEELLADERGWESERIFWIGTNQHPTRLALHKMGREFPNVLDVELMEWNRGNPKALVSKSRQVSIPGHRLFKYLADCPGQGYSGRLKWLLATGRPVFVIARDAVEHWHADLEPWVHYVPVAADLSDLLDNHQRMETEPGLYERIGSEARSFAMRNLRLEEQMTQVAAMLGGTPPPQNG